MTFGAAAVTFGASAKGPLHKDIGRPNEDAWITRRWRDATMIAVADGMGSRPYARTGATAACRAAADATRWAVRSAETDAYRISTEVEIRWEAKVVDHCAPARASTTCLWAIHFTNGPLVVGQLGDGLAAVSSPTGNVHVLAERAGFSNETEALGTPAPAVWSTHRDPVAQPGTVVLLATDGVSDDLIAERLADFIGMIVSEFSPLPPRPRWTALQRELTAWPTPRHLDDKTLAVLQVST